MYDLSEIIARNAKMLKNRLGIPESEIQRRSGMAQKTFNNIVNMAHKPTLRTVERLAAGFKVEPWQLLKPDFDKDLPSPEELEELEAAIAATDKRGAADAIRHALSIFEDDEARSLLTDYLSQLDADS